MNFIIYYAQLSAKILFYKKENKYINYKLEVRFLGNFLTLGLLVA